MIRETVVAATQRLTKPQLHAKIMLGWSRAVANHGKGVFADAIECSTTGLDKQMAGSMPGLECLDRALDVEPTVLDDWLAHKGKRLVNTEAVCDSDDFSLLLAKAMVWLREAEHPDSPGGRAIVHSEVLRAEHTIRQLHRVSGDMIGRINAMRENAA